MEKSEIRQVIMQMENARRKNLHPYFQELGLTPGQPRILHHLYEQDHITQKELADRCSMDVATVSRTLDKLEEAGYLTREKHPGCRRSFLIALTQEGREKAGEVSENFRRLDDRICSGLSGEELDTFLACAKKIVENLESQTES